MKADAIEYKGRKAVRLTKDTEKGGFALLRGADFQDGTIDWYKLRREWPWVYEAYADLKLETWTKVRIEVKGHSAKLYRYSFICHA